jgi:hypothetical protein
MSTMLNTITDAIISRADKYNAEVIIEDTFEHDEIKTGLSVIVQNLNTMKFGVISTNVKEFPDEPIVFFEFNDKLYQYAVTEGFEKDDMLTSFDNKVLRKITQKEFIEYIVPSMDD